MKYLQVAVNTHFMRSLLTYSWDEELYGAPKIGEIFYVSLGKSNKIGLILKEYSALEWDQLKISAEQIKSIDANALRPFPFSLNSIYLNWISWMARYYHYPLGLLISDILPSPIIKNTKLATKKKSLLFLRDKTRKITELILPERHLTIIKKMTDEKMNTKWRNDFDRYYIHGVTGSGKSLIYRELIKKKIEDHKSVLFLLPEINLTPQFAAFFSENFEMDVYLYHSTLTNLQKKRYGLSYHYEKNPYLVIAVRSGLFLPMQNLGLIIIDEEHDASFKQDDRCPYSAKDMATKRAELEQFPIVYGSATPSVEYYFQFTEKLKNNYFRLSTRLKEVALPSWSFEKMPLLKDPLWPFTQNGFDAIEEAVARGEQVIVFVNRLGHAQIIQCYSYGYRFQCPNCSVVLRYFKKRHELSCSYCDFKEPMPSWCPKCQNLELTQLGFGTEKLEAILAKRFPKIRLMRFDRDEIKTFKELSIRLDLFLNHERDLLIGTQMLAKGHNFSKVLSVHIFGMDQLINSADFRSFEKSFQLLTQVSGRAGREQIQGKVFLYTAQLDLPLYKIVAEGLEEEFYQSEVQLRKDLNYPPFSRLALIRFSGINVNDLQKFSSDWKYKFDSFCEQHALKVSVTKPFAPTLEKRANKYSLQLLLRSTELKDLHQVLSFFDENTQLQAKVSQKVDVDPYSII